MNAIAIETVTTADTHEEIRDLPVLRDYHINGGYDWMEAIEAEGWSVLGSWGCDGWDLGQWPYVMIAAIRTADAIGDLFGVASYCEGDVTCTFYRTQAAQWEKITEHAFYSWKNGQAHGPTDLPETAADLPARYRGPYRPAFD
ncbi:hypothetical protein D477_006658 [Arthrobacter crystallopoietes BAB-32]|uniref:Uncharacterized protein n=1 Tax=Arthrobacter crystallopoietes BAB-32 TaxID=1246476 RepID=N1V4P5_9MICC|nr:hypothetical protein [Arthrobacter crystallopoietes]EMY34994.1 hypothetical protein D477_006658 [Arthrobacter crystallopoietes BAB-32]